jgi:N-ethylmaleimide reductase
VDAVIDGIGSDRTALRISPQNTFNDIDDSDPQALLVMLRQVSPAKVLPIYM